MLLRNISIISLAIALPLLYFNWMAAFGWLLLIVTLIVVLVSMLSSKKAIHFRQFIIILGFFMGLVPGLIIASSISSIKESITTTKENINDIVDQRDQALGLNTEIINDTNSTAYSSDDPRVKMVFVDG